MRSMLVVCLWLYALTIGLAQTNDWSKRIVSKTKHPLTSFINPHVSDINILIIDGKRFEHVRGVKKFYLHVPQTNAILFVVDEKDYSVTYHIFNMDTDKDIAIHARNSVFGQMIGSANPRDTVDELGGGKLVLCNLDQGANSTLPALTNLYSVKSLYYLDAVKKAVVAEKTIFYDKAGSVILEQDASPPF